MTVKFYSFTKRPNSTKQPAPNSELLTLSSVELKEECSFINPVLKIKGLTQGTAFVPGMYNYVYIPLWLRYYFIQDWTYINGLWEVSLIIDVMASHKTEIGNTQTYIERCASASDGNIIDTLYPAEICPAIESVAASGSLWDTTSITLSGMTFVVGCINNDTSYKIGAVTYYALTLAQLKSLLGYLFSNSIFNSSSITEMSEGLYKSLFNPFQYIVSCTAFPFGLETFASAAVNYANIKVGYWDTGISALVVESIYSKRFISVTIPNHPQISRGAYLNRAPYTKLTLFAAPFGSIPIDPDVLSIGNYLHCPVFVDNISGDATLRVAITTSQNPDTTGQYTITERTANVGIPIQLAQVMPDYIGSIGNGVGALTSAITGNIAGVISSTLSAVSCSMPSVSTTGANGSFLEVLPDTLLIVEHYPLVNEDNEEYGRPLCDKRTISTLSGYIKCGNADHAFGGTDYERKTINDYMRSGFFYE